MSPLPADFPASAVIPDPEEALKAWARADSVLGPMLAGPKAGLYNVATSLPANATFPFLTVFQIPGSASDDYAPVGTPLLQFDAWAAQVGRSGDVRPDYKTASLLIRTLVARLRDVFGEPINLGTGGALSGVLLDVVLVHGPERETDPSGLARYRLDATAWIVPA